MKKKKLHIPDISSKELFDQNVGAKWRERRVRYEQQKKPCPNGQD